MKIVGVYFSGTGNTEWVAKVFEEELNGREHQANMISIEDHTASETARLFEEADVVGFFYPIYGSDMPSTYEHYMLTLSRFVMTTRKPAFCITSVAIYSGDGALMTKKFCDKMNLELTWAHNIHMPCNFNTFIPGFQIPSEQKTKKLKLKAKLKISNIVDSIEQGIKKLEGTDILNRAMGSVQRISNRGMMDRYDIKINVNACIKCGKCVKLCPTKNITLPSGGVAVKTNGKCAICLRCINHCPVYAIRIMNPKKDKPFKQYKGPNN